MKTDRQTDLPQAEVLEDYTAAPDLEADIALLEARDVAAQESVEDGGDHTLH